MYIIGKKKSVPKRLTGSVYDDFLLQHGQKSPPSQPPGRRRSLHRTLSDESIYRGQRLPSLTDSMMEAALGADVLFSCSTLPRSPTTRGVPLRRPSYKLGVKLHGNRLAGNCHRVAGNTFSANVRPVVMAIDRVFYSQTSVASGTILSTHHPSPFLFTGDLSASDTSLVDLVERHRGPLPQELMPLPSSERDSPLDWTHLVDVANTFDSERNTHYGIVILFFLIRFSVRVGLREENFPSLSPKSTY